MTRISRRKFIGNAAAAVGAGMASRLVGPLAVSLSGATTLPRRPFGSTGVEVTPVGLGGGGRFFEPTPTDEAGAELVVKAVNQGMHYVETSTNYGPRNDLDKSERRIGMAMKTHRSRVFLETKVDSRDYDGAMKEMEQSLKLLQTDHIDLILHHNLRAEDVDRLLEPDGAEHAIRKMIDQKVVRFRGFSCHIPALTLDAIHRVEPDAVQLPLNATRVPDFETEVLPLTTSRGIAVIAMKVCGHGLFLKESIGGAFDSRHQRDERPEEHRFAPPPEAFENPTPAAEDYLRYAMSLPIATALVGMDSRATLDSVMRTASSFSPLSAAERKTIHEKSQVFSKTGYWIPRPRRNANATRNLCSYATCD